MTIRIKASRGVYRRCGVVHSTKAVDYPDDEFTPEQLETLKADPVLTVTVLEGDAMASPGPDGGPPQDDGQGLPTTTPGEGPANPGTTDTTTPGQDGPPPQNTAGDGSTSANGGPAEGAAPGAPAQQKATRPAKATGSGSKGGANKTAKEGGK